MKRIVCLFLQSASKKMKLNKMSVLRYIITIIIIAHESK